MQKNITRVISNVYLKEKKNPKTLNLCAIQLFMYIQLKTYM